MVDRSYERLLGFKWFGEDEEILLAVGKIDDENARNWNMISILTLKENQRLVGMKSAKCSEPLHKYFQWMICSEEV